jgi:hypothetical protein
MMKIVLRTNSTVKSIEQRLDDLTNVVRDLRLQPLEAAGDKFGHLGLPAENVAQLVNADRLLLKPEHKKSFVSALLNGLCSFTY